MGSTAFLATLKLGPKDYWTVSLMTTLSDC